MSFCDDDGYDGVFGDIEILRVDIFETERVREKERERRTID